MKQAGEAQRENRRCGYQGRWASATGQQAVGEPPSPGGRIPAGAKGVKSRREETDRAIVLDGCCQNDGLLSAGSTRYRMGGRQDNLLGLE